MPKEALFIAPAGDAASCDIHDWVTDGMAARLILEMRRKHGRGGVNTCRDYFGDRFAHDPTDAIDRRLDLERVCSKLPERQRHIIESYYRHEALFREIGTDLGVSEMRISQLHAETLLRMRDVFTE